MALLQIIYAPNKIFREKAEKITSIDQDIIKLANDMLDTMYFEKAVGIGANMVGVKKQIVVIDIKSQGTKPYVMINPEITYYSPEKVDFEEASISFPGISAIISRPDKIKVRYLDLDGIEQELEAEGYLSRVIQHEVDYLNGKVFLDYLSKLKQDFLMKKLHKFIKNFPPHIHGSNCHH